MILARWQLIRALLVLTLACSLRITSGSAAELDSGAQRLLRSATFEVVQLKPPDGEVTYERPLPMDLMPYQERTDHYRSVGTAFAIAANRYVTAGHVLGVGLGSQFGPPALRDAAGKVYDIDQIYAYSDREDFVVFSLRDPPKDVRFLSAGTKPNAGDSVFAVGNALGQGVVIRDGLYTSDTPEEQNGEWNWLRFSAAASPGNSGGPLVDHRGKLVGVVLRKSPSENLNYALPFARITAAKQGEGKIASRNTIRLPIMDASETLKIDERFTLPQSIAEFYKTFANIVTGATKRSVAELLEHNAAHIFPHGAGSERLLHTVERSPFPAWMREAQNGEWQINTFKPSTVDLEHNGFVELAGSAIRLRAPDDVSLAKLYGDPKLEMDLLLKAYTLRRAVGTDVVRVTSLGKPKNTSSYTDAYGRTWQIQSWVVPYQDTMLTLVSLATPGGFTGFLISSASGLTDLILQEQQVLLDYIYLTLEGTVSQWQDYLAQPGVQPQVFSSLKLAIEPDRRIQFQSPRCQLAVTPDLLKLSKDSVVRLQFGFFHDGDHVVWDVAGISMGENLHNHNWVNVWRKSEPPSSLPEGFQSDWNKLKSHEFPYNSHVFNEEGETRISTDVPVADNAQAARIRYGERVIAEGVQPQQAMSHKLDLLQHSFKMLEQ